ncbi:MAG: ATP-dependent RecD-like DNA helicase [Roseburia sp.]|uniref:SF1B family DNA helicase RecD2 n=1 Tax=Roseburia sp. 831b TaxID=1261635 RepID=UPI0009529EB0|nr:ATP-dependent RecD-like DNA helicase [Roseburia sp. 831b]MCI5920211.1 ATP-dependent RecD-like DNA helicase [Roseburia sp.]MDD6217420.1 ATP-dependent RecD-like DNA helicase [Roseburia sp.]WVK72029.1 ATP-dependent RecD-like DNA helicase [Roseburia sp. 831b]
MEKLAGYVEHIIYRNTDNGYTVLNLVSGEDEITCVGIFSDIAEGENIEAEGDYTSHPTYGKQFKVERFEEKAPEDEEAIERYLGSGAIKGIGLALAARIVRRFKEDTFRIIEEEPERLAEIKGISERKAMEIAAQVNEKRDLRQAMIFLQQYGITMNLAVKVYAEYGQEVYGIIKENPYRLADDIAGVGFRTADEIASRVGIRTDSDFRIKSGILYTLLQASAEGHTYLPQEELTKRASNLLEVEPEYIERHYMDLAIERKIIMKQMQEQTQIYAATFYYMEANTATMLRGLNVSYDVPDIEIEQRIRKIEKQTGMTLDEHQVTAVKEAVRNGLLIITGGPGTGKTTTINTIIRYFESEGMDIFLAAPTGRAAKRMSETTGFEARTIHRMLELNGGMEGSAGFERNETNPLETDVIIIDEMSMVDISLMTSLLKAIVAGTRLILVGDVNQLPSVGPGSVLKDIIDSGTCNVVKLTKIFRQASESDIIVNAHKINRGEEVTLDNKSMDFFFLKRYDADVIISVTLQLIKQKLPKFVNATPYDIQVLTPMRKGLLGVERLNGILQQYMNPPEKGKREKEVGSTLFREGDKIMQTRNNYQLEWEIRSKYGLTIDKGTGVFNGDMGVIREINDYTEIVTVEFEEGRMVEYPFKLLEELELAYAITIHKSQGSEYPAVVIPLLSGPAMLMNRNLLYTAVTRARKCVTLVGNDVTFQQMIQNTSQQKRYSGLANRLREQAENL